MSVIQYTMAVVSWKLLTTGTHSYTVNTPVIWKTELRRIFMLSLMSGVLYVIVLKYVF